MTRKFGTLLALTVLALMILSGAPDTSAQTGKLADEELEIGVCYRHADAELQRPSDLEQFGLNDPRNSVGPCGGYTHFIGRTNGRGNFGIGFDGGATFSNTEGATDGGKLASAKFAYKMVLQDNRPDKSVRPGIKGTVGFAREQFKNRCQSTGLSVICSRGANAWTYGGGAFIDFGKNRQRLRLGVNYYYSFYLKQSAFFPDRKNKHNFEASISLVL